MKVVHVLKNGDVLEDISGYVIKREDNPEIYRVIEQIRRKGKAEHEEEDKE